MTYCTYFIMGLTTSNKTKEPKILFEPLLEDLDPGGWCGWVNNLVNFNFTELLEYDMILCKSQNWT